MSARSCRDVRADLSAYLEGDLDAGPTGETRSHLESCAACRHELEQLRLTIGALRRLPDLPPPAGILTGISSRLWPEPWYRRLFSGRQWFPGVPVGALATLLVIVGISLFQARNPDVERMVTGTPVVPGAPLPPAPRQNARAAPESAARGDLPLQVSPAAPPPRPPEMREAKKASRREKPSGFAPSAGPQERIFATTPTLPVAREQNRILDFKGSVAQPERDGTLSKQIAAAESSLPEDLAAAPSPRADHNRAAGLIVARDKDAGGLSDKADATSYPNAAVVGALPTAPRQSELLPAGKDEATSFSGGAGSGGDALRSRLEETQPTMTAGVEKERRTLGAAAATQAESPETRRPSRFTIVTLLTAGGDTVDDIERLLRREGAGEITVSVLEPRAASAAFAPHRGRLGLLPEPSRGWLVAASVPRSDLARVLGALTGRAGLRILELPAAPATFEDRAKSVGLRITLLR